MDSLVKWKIQSADCQSDSDFTQSQLQYWYLHEESHNLSTSFACDKFVAKMKTTCEIL